MIRPLNNEPRRQAPVEVTVAGTTLANACAQKRRNQVCTCGQCNHARVLSVHDVLDEHERVFTVLSAELKIIMGGIPILSELEYADLQMDLIARQLSA